MIRQGCVRVQDSELYHIECNDMAERDLASFVALDKMLIDQDRAASGRQAQYKGTLCRRVECLDAFYS